MGRRIEEIRGEKRRRERGKGEEWQERQEWRMEGRERMKEIGRGNRAWSLPQSPLKTAEMVLTETMSPLRPEGDKSSPMILLGHQQNLAL